MKNSLLMLLCTVALLLGTVSGASALSIQNGDFSSGLSGWQSGGSASVSNDMATLSDADVPYSFLYQETAFAPGSYTLSFDYQIIRLGLAGIIYDDYGNEQENFNDLFSVSFYSADESGAVKPDTNKFPKTVISPPLNLDYNGILENPGSISSSTLGLDWQHFSMTFQNTSVYIIPTFELFDFNYIENDSEVYIDNVIIEPAPVPEPTTLLLFGGGLLGLFGIRKLRSRGNT